MDAMKITNTS